jgi:hypothetical protein
MCAFLRVCLCEVYEAICENLCIFWGRPAYHICFVRVVDQALNREELVARAGKRTRGVYVT